MELPADVQVTATEGRVLYRLPHRRLGIGAEGGERGGFLVALGAAGCILTLAYVQFLTSAFSGGRSGQALMAAIFTSPIGAIGVLALLLLLWACVGGRSEILLTPERLFMRERIGPFTFRRTVRTVDILQFRAHPVGAGRGALDMELKDGPQRRWAVEYPMPLLEALAADLSRRKDEILKAPPAGPTDVDILPDGIRVVVRPLGWTLWLGPLAAVGSTAFTLMLVGLLVVVGEKARFHLPAVALLLGLLWLGGIAAAVAVFRWSRRTVELECSERTLKVVESDPLGRRVREWPRMDVWGFEVAGNRLEARLAKGRRPVLLAGRDGPTLEWIAGLLRRGRRKKEVEVLAVEAPRGVCQVCATEMAERVVWCRRCRTPHHLECWIYTGMCSTFGCREIGFVEA